MSDVTIVSDLQGLCKLKVEKGETQAAFAERLARKAFGVAEGDWETLTEASQEWVNNTMLAVDAKKSFPLPSGIEDVISGEEASGVTEEEKMEESPSKKKKAAPKKAAAKAPEKAAPAKAPAAKKAAAAKAPAKKAAKSNGAKTQVGPKGRFGLDDKIKLLKKENPFREGTKCANWYALIKDGMTVEAAIDAGVPRHHIRWEQTLGHVKIG
jgi:pyruvate/2-oxoglutarate dehydrogenase complex dihydrolipoamide acyltransferase (E2) component